MRITFVNVKADIYPPLGLCYLSSYVKANVPGVETALFEITYDMTPKEAARRIARTGPDMVGITAYTVGFHDVMVLCRCLRECLPDVIICLGGPHITSLPGSLPRDADIGVCGEGEETFREICSMMHGRKQLSPALLKDIRGICYHDGSNIVTTPPHEILADLDSLPLPDLSILNMKWYTARRMYFVMKGCLRGFTLLTSRGCPFQCRFCQASAHWGQCRYHSAERVITELERIRREYPRVNAINIIDDLFIGNRKRLREVVSLIRERGLHHGVVFNVNGHANIVDEEMIGLLKSINVTQISYGFESGSERVLAFLKKDSATVANNRRAAEITNAAGIGVGGQFMIGSPGETEQEIRETIEFIESTPMSHVHVSSTTPLPGTEFWGICREKGLVADDMDWRRLDFGNPDNPDLLYCNAEGMTQRRFGELRAEVNKAAERWNPPPSFTTNFSFWHLYSLDEFALRLLKWLLRLICRPFKQSRA